MGDNFYLGCPFLRSQEKKLGQWHPKVKCLYFEYTQVGRVSHWQSHFLLGFSVKTDIQNDRRALGQHFLPWVPGVLVRPKKLGHQWLQAWGSKIRRGQGFLLTKSFFVVSYGGHRPLIEKLAQSPTTFVLGQQGSATTQGHLDVAKKRSGAKNSRGSIVFIDQNVFGRSGSTRFGSKTVAGHMGDNFCLGCPCVRREARSRGCKLGIRTEVPAVLETVLKPRSGFVFHPKKRDSPRSGLVL